MPTHPPTSEAAPTGQKPAKPADKRRREQTDTSVTEKNPRKKIKAVKIPPKPFNAVVKDAHKVVVFNESNPEAGLTERQVSLVEEKLLSILDNAP